MTCLYNPCTCKSFLSCFPQRRYTTSIREHLIRRHPLTHSCVWCSLCFHSTVHCSRAFWECNTPLRNAINKLWVVLHGMELLPGCEKQCQSSKIHDSQPVPTKLRTRYLKKLLYRRTYFITTNSEGDELQNSTICRSESIKIVIIFNSLFGKSYFITIILMNEEFSKCPKRWHWVT
jgi:hypothetical protein